MTPHLSPESRIQGSPAFLIALCLVASLGGLLFGFDTAVISGTVERVKQQYGLSELLKGWFTSSALVGCILGAAIAGVLGDRFGRKPTLLVSSVFLFVSALYPSIPVGGENLVGRLTNAVTSMDIYLAQPKWAN